MRKIFGLAALMTVIVLSPHVVRAADQLVGQTTAQAEPDAAAYIAAQAVMQRTIRQLLDHLKTQAKAYAEDEQLLYAMLREVVLPVVDMRLISRLVLGSHWKAVSESQKERFIMSFQAVLMKNYGKVLFLLPDIRVEYAPPLPQKEDQPRKKYQIVRTTVITSANKPPLSVNYSLIDRDGWKVFDIIIEGTSLVRQFRSGFDQEIREAGFEALLERLGKSDVAPANS